MYSGSFSDRASVESAFNITLPATQEIVFAHYSSYDDADGSDYEMWARVLFVDRSVTPAQLFEVHGSHCSCYGLEDQWKPEPVTIADIVADLKMGSTWGVEATVKERLRAALLALMTKGE